MKQVSTHYDSFLSFGRMGLLFWAFFVSPWESPLMAAPVTCLVGWSETQKPILGFYYQKRATRSIEALSSCLLVEGGYRLVTGQIHGNETATAAVLRIMIDRGWFDRLDSSAFDGGLLVIPTVNVDGALAGTRQNARGVDLNRNFSSRLLFGSIRKLVGLEFPGAAEYTASEVRALSLLIRRARFYFDLHGFQNKIYVPMTAASKGPLNTERMLRDVGRRLTAQASRVLGASYEMVDGLEVGDVGTSDEFGVTVGVPSTCLEMSARHRDIMSLANRDAVSWDYFDLMTRWFEDLHHFRVLDPFDRPVRGWLEEQWTK